MSAETETINSEVLEQVAKIEIFDGKGEKVNFGSLFENQKAIVVFIRHFFCGNCMHYVRALADIPSEKLSAVGVKISLVGCGDWKIIENYKDQTGFTGDVYANPDSSLYKALEMTTTLDVTPSGQTKATYLKDGFWTTIFTSISWAIRKNPTMLANGGPIAQNGGDLVLGPGIVCQYAHRMQHTEDHVEVATLMEKAGVTYP